MIIEKMHRVMHDVKGVEKSSYNQSGRYKYTSHEDLTAKLGEAYRKHGIVRTASVVSYTRNGDELSMLVEVAWNSIEDASDRYAVQSLGECGPLTKNGKTTPQQAGIALSYAVKSAEFKAFSLTGDNTPDGDDLGKDDDDVVALVIDRYESARTQAEITEISDDVRRNWGAYRHAKHDIEAARNAALARCS